MKEFYLKKKNIALTFIIFDIVPRKICALCATNQSQINLSQLRLHRSYNKAFVGADRHLRANDRQVYGLLCRRAGEGRGSDKVSLIAN